MDQNYKRKRGDRRDGWWVKDAHGMQVIMANLLPKRTDCEVCLQQEIDVTEILKYLEKKNEGRAKDERMTVFHCVVTALDRMVRERPYMNRFIMGGRLYERYDISLGFVCKRRFTDHSEEALMFLTPGDNDTVNEVSKKIIGDVHETRKSETSTGGVDELMNAIAKFPRPIIRLICWTVKKLDWYGKNPKAITDGDPNYATIFLSNLGSIKCPAVYHHLNDYGTNSIMITVGMMNKKEVIMADGSKQVRDFLPIGATLDERIADGFYFARSLKLVQHICANPELLEKPLCEPSGFEYK